MIDPNILKILESNIQDPSYSVLISKFNITEFCNKDRLEVLLQQYNPNLEIIIENKENYIELLKKTLEDNNIEIPDFYEIKINSCINRTLTIESLLDFNTNDAMFISGLTGSLSNDTESDVNKKDLKISLYKKNINFIEKDAPNLFNKTKFRIKNSNLIIAIPKKIETISIQYDKISNDEIIDTQSYNENNIENNQIIIPFDEEFLMHHTNENEYILRISYGVKEDVSTQLIESITAPFNKEIDISFNNKYSKLPGVIITTDEDTKPFSGYSTYFTRNEDNNYIGVKIEFKGVKRTKNYNDINITIIGINGDKDADSN